MGFLLKIAVFAVAAYTVWTAIMRWYGALGGRPPGRPVTGRTTGQSTGQSGESAPRPQPQPQAQPDYRAQPAPRTIEETRQCAVCGTFVSVSAAKCGRPDCPLPG